MRQNWFQPRADLNALYVSIHEIPQPRDWGTVQLTLGDDVLLSREIALVRSALDEMLGWIEPNLLKAAVFEQVKVENVTYPMQHRIQALLNGCLPCLLFNRRVGYEFPFVFEGLGGQRTLRMLAGVIVIFTYLLKMSSSTITLFSPSVVW